ncbi:hypothetical protein [Marinobacterium rhizophilum]|uniref:hypothetical protein n=1 Tax=Marinobacterium rhizophilum TaxID=420402 RepID=UPI0012EBA179|nr:hypothetical protein [Marinobacterium rhizophilum]
MSYILKSLSKCSIFFVAIIIASCDMSPYVNIGKTKPPSHSSGDYEQVESPRPQSTPEPSRANVGKVKVEASGVYVNDQPVYGVVQLFDGDDVRTDSSGWATIYFNVGGSVRLPPKSDPLLRLVAELGCLSSQLVAYIKYGDFSFEEVTEVCICDKQLGFCAEPASDFRIVVDNRRASITVSKGSLLVSLGYPRPYERHKVLQGFGMIVENGKSSKPQRIVQ